jgi:hypothetical protein
MLKKAFLLIALVLPILGYSQNYTVKTIIGENYKPLTGAQLIAEDWTDQTSFSLSVETIFNWYDRSFDFLAQDALIFYGIGLTEASEFEDSTSISALGFFSFLQSRPEGSPLLFLMEGEVGDRIIKLEWANAGFRDGDEDDFVNFQVWLFEKDARVEVHIGPNSVIGPNAFIAGAAGPKIGLYRRNVKANDTKVFKSWLLTGDPANPTINTGGLQVSLGGIPDEGTIYVFEDANAASLPKLRVKNGLRTYPNPSRDVVNIELPESVSGESQLQVLDMQGREIFSQCIGNSRTMRVDISGWAPGVYSARLTSGAGNEAIQKIVKVR